MATNKLSAYGSLPQDPYFPQSEPEGPTFLDTQACVCALQETPEEDSNDAKWQCIGNQTKGVYLTKDGKWFNTVKGGRMTELPMTDASNPPDTETTLTFNPNSELLESADVDKLDVWDKACTGINQTTFSTSLYRAALQLSQEGAPIDAAPVRKLYIAIMQFWLPQL